MRHSTLIESHLLNDRRLLKYLLELPCREEVDESVVRKNISLSFSEVNRHQPDHVFENLWHNLQYSKKHRFFGPLLAISNLSNHFFCQEKTGYKVKLDLFEDWQLLMTRISCLPIHAYYLAKNDDLISDPDYNWPLYPYHPLIEDYISREQLNESHQHLNGSSSLEDVWLDALKEPDRFLRAFDEVYSNDANANSLKVKELCDQIDESINPNTLKHRLFVARNIREILCSYVQNNLDLDSFDKFKYPFDFHEEVFFSCCDWPAKDKFTQKVEHQFLAELSSKFIVKSNEKIERLFWIYLLIQNQFLSLLVHRDDHFGFDQFQKYTFTDLRDITEREYTKRFQQAHGKGKRSQVGFMDARVAPKDNPKKLESLILSILNGYYRYLSGDYCNNVNSLKSVLDFLAEENFNDKLMIALVVHFIKNKPKENDLFPYKGLYKDLANKAFIMLELFKVFPQLKHWVRGIDAASNELDTPPEVFAPLFRVLKRQGIAHATYHVGEDFVHLISGIRVIDDALRFLPLTAGDRLGHCTAIGILPSVWSRSFPTKVYLKQETHLLDCIFIWRSLRSDPDLLKWANIAASKAIEMAYLILDEVLTIEQLDTLMGFRELYSDYGPLLNGEPSKLSPASIWDTEYEKIDRLMSKKENKSLFNVYRVWLTDQEVRLQRNSLIEVKTDWLPDNVLLVLQQKMMKEIARRNIAIECPLTSNLRISQYQYVHEHHVFRWLNIVGASCEGDVPMAVCLASDDPGIFVVDLKSEVYHLFVALKNYYKLSDSEALSKIAEINENSRVYRFHNSLFTG